MRTRFSIRVLIFSVTLVALCFGVLRFVWNRGYRDGFHDGLICRMSGNSLIILTREDKSVPFRPAYAYGLDDGYSAIPFNFLGPDQEPKSMSAFAQKVIAWSETAHGLDYATRQSIHRVAEEIIKHPDTAYSNARARVEK